MFKSIINKGLKKLKWATNDIHYKLGSKSLSSNSSEKRILLYHGVTANAKTDINARFIDIQLFEKQIAYFKANFNIVSLTNYFNGPQHPKKMTVAITFDDGYLNNLKEALPILEKYKIPATFFITTIKHENYNILWTDALDLFCYASKKKELSFNGIRYKKSKNEFTSKQGSLKKYLKNGGWQDKKNLTDTILASNQFINNSSFNAYHQLLSEKDIVTLSQSKYVTIGSHGLYHNCLTKIDTLLAKKELEISKKYLENLIQKEVIHFAYPDGAYNQNLIAIAEKIGYKYQSLVDYHSEKEITDKRVENRIGINPYISFNNQIQCLIDGKY